MTARHHLGLRGAEVMQTEAFLLAERAVHDVASAGAMGVIHGLAGSGKTFAVQAAIDSLPVPACGVQFPSRPSMLRVAQQLLQRLSPRAPGRGNRFELSDRLLDVLAERDRLIVVDEAQWLTRESIEYLRHLHDDPATRFGLLLVGGDGCWQVLSREPMLRSRLYRRVDLHTAGLARRARGHPALPPALPRRGPGAAADDRRPLRPRAVPPLGGVHAHRQPQSAPRTTSPS